MSNNDLINHPSHYERSRYTCKPADLTVMLPHPFASAVEYMIRAPYKGTEEQDYRKAAWWLQKALDTPFLWCAGNRKFCSFKNAVLSDAFMHPWPRANLMAAVWAMRSKCTLIDLLFMNALNGLQIRVVDVQTVIVELNRLAGPSELPTTAPQSPQYEMTNSTAAEVPADTFADCANPIGLSC